MTIFRRRPRVAVVHMQGVIGKTINDAHYTHLLDRIAQNRRVSAVVLDINSPGGSASASDIIYRAVLRVSRHKHVTAYINGLGASGGYYIACGANTIYSSHAAMIGSIGVIYMRPVIQNMMEKLGIGLEVIKAGHLKDMNSFWHHPNPEEKDKLQTLIDYMYNNFVGIVSLSRNIDIDQARELATGELFTAPSARHHNLIDHIADINDAIEEARKIGNAGPRTQHHYQARPLLSHLNITAPASQTGILQPLAELFTPGFHYIDPAFAPSASA